MTQAYNLSQLANNLNTSGQLDATDGLVNAVPVANGGTGASSISGAIAILGPAIYPVGSIYINASSATNPSTLLGFGTWVAFGAGRVPVGVGSGFTAGDTGGSADATLVAHNHPGSYVGVNLTSHYHNFGIGRSFASTKPGAEGVASGPYGFTNSNGYEDSLTTGYDLSSHVHGLNVESDGTSATNANLQPYIVVYMWQRTA